MPHTTPVLICPCFPHGRVDTGLVCSAHEHFVTRYPSGFLLLTNTIRKEATVNEYRSVNEARKPKDKRVHHNSDECPSGRDIPHAERKEGRKRRVSTSVTTTELCTGNSYNPSGAIQNMLLGTHLLVDRAFDSALRPASEVVVAQ